MVCSSMQRQRVENYGALEASSSETVMSKRIVQRSESDVRVDAKESLSVC